MRALAAALAVALVACGPPSEPAETAPPVPEVPAVPEVPPASGAPDRPETVVDTVRIEGMAEPIRLRPVRYSDVPLPFSTDVPEDWVDSVVSSGEGTAVRFTAGEPPRQGLLSLFVPSAPNRAGVAALAEAAAEGYGGAREIDAIEVGVSRAFTFSGPDAVGTVTVREHAGVPFYVVEAYPVELGDGFVPRAALVLDRLRWLDTGDGLAGRPSR